MSIDAHRWLMTAPDAPLVRSEFKAQAQVGEVVVAGRRLRRLPHRPRLLLRRRAHQPAAAAGPRPRDQRRGGGSRRRRASLARQIGDRAGRAALRRMRPVQAGAHHDLPRAEDAGQRHRGRLRLAHRRAGARPVRSRPVRACRPRASSWRRCPSSPTRSPRRTRRCGARASSPAAWPSWSVPVVSAATACRWPARSARRSSRSTWTTPSSPPSRNTAHRSRSTAGSSTARRSRPPSTISPRPTACAAPSGSSSSVRAAPAASSPPTACWCMAPPCRWSASPWTRSRYGCPT